LDLVHSTYGDEFGSTGSPQTPWGFTGEQADENGLLYLRARYYNSALGQFISLDPLELGNRYQYVNSNPVRWTDPSGLQGSECTAQLAQGTNMSPVVAEALCHLAMDPNLKAEIDLIVEGAFASAGTISYAYNAALAANAEAAAAAAASGAAVSTATLALVGALGLTVGSLFVLSAMIEHTPHTAEQIAGMKVPMPSQGDLDKAKKVLTSVTGQCSPQPQLEPAPNAPNPPNSNDRNNDRCSEENMLRLIGARTVAQVVYDSPFGDKVNGRVLKPTEIAVQKKGSGSVAQFASWACNGSEFPPIDVYPGRTYDAIDEGHTRFVASRLLSDPTKLITISGKHRATTPYDYINGNFVSGTWEEIEWK
jgi:RHS repeat-associated protein